MTHWLISTQVKQLKKLRGKGAAATAEKWRKMKPQKRVDLGNKMSKARGGSGTLSLQQQKQFVKLVKVNSRRDSS